MNAQPQATPRQSTPWHVVIIGGGFAGLWATRALARVPVRVSLVDRGNHHVFQPLLYQVATAGLSAPDIAAPLRHILRGQRNVTVLMGDVVAIDTAGKTLRFADGELPGYSKLEYDMLDYGTLSYDVLLIASGSTHAYFGHDDWTPMRLA